jgi:hypothetical protein
MKDFIEKYEKEVGAVLFVLWILSIIWLTWLARKG